MAESDSHAPLWAPDGYAGSSFDLYDAEGFLIAACETRHDSITVRSNICERELDVGAFEDWFAHVSAAPLSAQFRDHPWPANLAISRCLLALVESGCELRAGNDLLDLTLFYTVKLDQAHPYCEWARTQLPELIWSRGLVLRRSKENTTTQIIGPVSSRNLKRVVKRNSDCHATIDSEIVPVLRAWRLQCESTFGYTPNRENLSMLQRFGENCEAFRSSIRTSDGSVLAQSLVILDRQRSVLYDMLCAWDRQRAQCSPGTMMAFVNSQLAARSGFRYSLGYGDDGYKYQLLSALGGDARQEQHSDS